MLRVSASLTSVVVLNTHVNISPEISLWMPFRSAHILFDDAMTLTDDKVAPNDFVQQFMTVVNDAGR